jgi:heme exporter protein A
VARLGVRAGVLRFLLQVRDVIGIQADMPVQLNSVLIGWNSTANISVSESIAAITRGVLEANSQFRDCVGKRQSQQIAVTDLCFIELYRDAAITAAHAVRALPDSLEKELKRLGTRIDAASTLIEGDSVLDRLSAVGDMGHWSRLIVTDANADDIYCPPECYEVRCKSAIPPDALRRLYGKTCDQPKETEPAPEATSGDASPVETRYYPERLKYVFLSQRARAETLVQQRQPGLIESIIRNQRRNPGYDAKLGHTLFQLMVPLDYKAAAREQSRLLLVLDGYTANLPWELLQSEGEALVLRGANGAGKTTLLRILAGLTRPEAGRVARDAAHHWIGHREGLKPQETPRGHLKLWAKAWGSPVSTDSALSRLGLARPADVAGRYLSAGQRRRTALARLLLEDRPVWLLDEPYTALDSDGRVLVDTLIAEHRAKGGAIIAAIHGVAGFTASRDLVL